MTGDHDGDATLRAESLPLWRRGRAPARISKGEETLLAGYGDAGETIKLIAEDYFKRST